MTSYMNQLNDAAPVEIKNFAKLEAGTYVVVFSDLEIKEDLFPEQHKISVEFTVNDGPMTGRKCWLNQTLRGETSAKVLEIFKGTVCKLAGTTSTNGDIFATLTSAKGNLVEIDLVYKDNAKNPEKPWPTVYVNKLIAKAGTF